MNNYGYVFLFYDIGEKRVNKVFKICKRYLNHCQNSVFRGEISSSNLVKLKEELKKIIKDEDEILLIKTLNANSFEEEIIVFKNNNNKINKNFL